MRSGTSAAKTQGINVAMLEAPRACAQGEGEGNTNLQFWRTQERRRSDDSTPHYRANEAEYCFVWANEYNQNVSPCEQLK